MTNNSIIHRFLPLLVAFFFLGYCVAQQTATTAAQNDIIALNYALTLENLEYNFYRTGLQNFTQAEFTAAGFNSTIYTYFTLIRNHEQVRSTQWQLANSNIITLETDDIQSEILLRQ